MTYGAFLFLAVVGGLWLVAAGLAAWRLHRSDRDHSHPIAEHSDEYWRMR